jgi:hypothetical protein
MTDIPDKELVGRKRSIGQIGNYYGGLYVAKWNGRFWWGIGDHSGTDWDEIPESLFDALVLFEESRANSKTEEPQ